MGPQTQREQPNRKGLDSEPYKNTKQTKRKTKMEGLKVLIAVVFITTSSSLIASAPISGVSTAQHTFNYLIPKQVKGAIEEMKKLHQLINSSVSIQNSPHMIPNFNNQSCASTKTPNDNLEIAYMTLSDFKSPVYLAFSYEKKQGPKHVKLEKLIWQTSYYVNYSIGVLGNLIKKKDLPVPSVQSSMSEAELDQYCRRHLANHNLMSHVITDDVVKIYRNYVVLWKLKYVLPELSHCVSLVGIDAESQGD
ncbi:uncharacterized protein LOC114960312 [Acropora millepora]|uniref:uncharacterized protein LOC114960312 n=1 Tax=Acropora millepora TaxID=45264 RepID=UPI001CF2FA0F|nr:uncharacterized protein LOC114960312 [Acropora millepora]XP_029194481.2 uncharacterized protein LOC114960312 [Acropora millepora]